MDDFQGGDDKNILEKTSNLEYVFTVTWLNSAIKMAWSGHCLCSLEGKTRPAFLLNYSSETSRNLQPLRKHNKHYLNKLVCIKYTSYILTSYVRIDFWRVFVALFRFEKTHIILNFQIFAVRASSKICLLYTSDAADE